MAGLGREAIFAALATRLASVAGVQSVSRRWVDLAKVRPEQQPIVLLEQVEDRPQHGQMPQGGTAWELGALVWIYARVDDTSQAPASVLNPIVTAVEAALQIQGGDLGYATTGAPGTLGALCRAVAIEGITYQGGDEDGQAVAVLRLKLLAVAPQ